MLFTVSQQLQTGRLRGKVEVISKKFDVFFMINFMTLREARQY
jgi:hypothetical protein